MTDTKATEQRNQIALWRERAERAEASAEVDHAQIASLTERAEKAEALAELDVSNNHLLNVAIKKRNEQLATLTQERDLLQAALRTSRNAYNEGWNALAKHMGHVSNPDDSFSDAVTVFGFANALARERDEARASLRQLEAALIEEKEVKGDIIQRLNEKIYQLEAENVRLNERFADACTQRQLDVDKLKAVIDENEDQHSENWRQKAGHLEMERDQARAALREAGKDTERLDLLEKHANDTYAFVLPSTGKLIFVIWVNGEEYRGDSLRQVIDTARETIAKEKP